MEIFYYKIACIALLFVSSVFAGTSPIVLRRLSQTSYDTFSLMVQRTLVFSQGLASGVLLGGGLLHLIPSSLDGIHDALEKLGAPEWMIGFPAASFIAIIAFAIIYFFEGIIPFCYGGKHGHSHDEHDHHREEIQNEEGEEEGSEKNDEKEEVDERTSLLPPANREEEEVEERFSGPINSNPVEDDYRLFDEEDDDEEGEYIYLPPIVPQTEEEVKERKKQEEKKAAREREHHSHVNLTPILQKGNIIEKVLSALFLWFSLSIHSFFVGLALGSTDSESNFWLILIAISAHKLVAAYSLGIELERSIRKRWVFLAFIYLFSASTPTGIILGIFFGLVQDKALFGLISNIAIGSAAGAFIHVALFEFLFEFTQENKIWYEFVLYMLLFVVGYVIMAILSVYV